MKLSKEIYDEMMVSDIKYVPKEYRKHTKVDIFLQEKIASKKLQKKKVFSAIDVSESIGYKYLDGRRVVPRDVFIKFLLVFGCKLEEVQYYLLNFGYANLYIKNKRDSAIIYAIVNDYTYLELKQYLQHNEIPTL